MRTRSFASPEIQEFWDGLPEDQSTFPPVHYVVEYKGRKDSHWWCFSGMQHEFDNVDAAQGFINHSQAIPCNRGVKFRIVKIERTVVV